MVRREQPNRPMNTVDGDAADRHGRDHGPDTLMPPATGGPARRKERAP